MVSQLRAEAFLFLTCLTAVIYSVATLLPQEAELSRLGHCFYQQQKSPFQLRPELVLLPPDFRTSLKGVTAECKVLEEKAITV